MPWLKSQPVSCSVQFLFPLSSLHGNRSLPFRWIANSGKLEEGIAHWWKCWEETSHEPWELNTGTGEVRSRYREGLWWCDWRGALDARMGVWTTQDFFHSSFPWNEVACVDKPGGEWVTAPESSLSCCVNYKLLGLCCPHLQMAEMLVPTSSSSCEDQMATLRKPCLALRRHFINASHYYCHCWVVFLSSAIIFSNNLFWW